MLKLFTQLRRRHQNPNSPHLTDSDVMPRVRPQTTLYSNTPSTDHDEEYFDSASSSMGKIQGSTSSSGEDDVSGGYTEVDQKAASVGKNRMEVPPADDCCPICFGTFVVPCRGPCGHWYCGGCILQYWNYTAALQPCSCPMCSQKITKLTQEASLSQQQDANVIEVLRNVRKYNRLFLGGPYGMILKMVELPLYIKRMFTEMMNPDRPGAHLNKLRIFAMTLGFFYSISPFDFLGLGRHNVVDLFDYLAILLSLVLYGVGIYIRRQRFRNVRELAAVQR